MRILFDHECLYCAHVFEELVDQNPGVTIPCERCHGPTKRLISGTRIDPKLGVDSDNFPTMADKWAKVRYQRQKIEAKKAREHGAD